MKGRGLPKVHILWGQLLLGGLNHGVESLPKFITADDVL
jgi:hypothetical protein